MPSAVTVESTDAAGAAAIDDALAAVIDALGAAADALAAACVFFGSAVDVGADCCFASCCVLRVRIDGRVGVPLLCEVSVCGGLGMREVLGSEGRGGLAEGEDWVGGAGMDVGVSEA